MWIRYYDGDDGGVVLTRLYGGDPVLSVPGTVMGKSVIAVGEYCFSENDPPTGDPSEKLFYCGDGAGRGQEDFQVSCEELTAALERREIRALSGDYITEICLPESVKSIGNLCFYGCRKLRKVELFGRDSQEGWDRQQRPDPAGRSFEPVIGSDAFMNCHRLSRFILHTSVRERTSLRRILLQRTAATYVQFEDAAVYFPEYSEHYDLIGPAHIFELAIDGEGLRARQCFENEVFLPEACDAMFEQAAVSEDEKTLCRMAAARLQFPDSMPEHVRRMYETYLGEHIGVLAADAVRERDLTLILALAERGELTAEHLKQCLRLTTSERWIEGTRMLLGVRV